MAKNEFKNVKVEESEVEKIKPQKQNESRLGISLRNILDGSLLTRESVVKLLPFGLYIAFLTVAYIGNSYYSEKIIRKTNKVRNELKELEYEYISTKSDLMHVSKQSEIAIRLDSFKSGIKESLVPPVKIFEKVQSGKNIK